MKIKELIDNSKISTSPKLFINRTFFILELLQKSHGLRPESQGFCLFIFQTSSVWGFQRLEGLIIVRNYQHITHRVSPLWSGQNSGTFPGL